MNTIDVNTPMLLSWLGAEALVVPVLLVGHPVGRAFDRRTRTPAHLCSGGFILVDPSGIEPLTSTMPLWRSPS